MNERSRRLDWALLLPATAALPFRDVLVLGGTDELAQSLVDHGIATSWRRPSGPADRSSFVVAWHDCPFDLDRIAGHLEPQGVLYLEIDRRRPGNRRRGPRSVQRRLARHGCHLFSTHIVTPNLVEPRRYLPMDHAPALRWYLHVLFVAGTPFTRVVRACIAAISMTPMAGTVVRLVTLRYIVICTTTDDAASPLGVPGARGHESAIIVTSGYDQASRAVVLPFQPDNCSPRFAVKVASSPTTTIGTLREHERLLSLHATLPPHTARALPRPMGTYILAGRTACVQSTAPGPSMSVTVGRWARRLTSKCRDLDLVVDWLSEFATATRVETAEATSDWTSIYREAAEIIDFPPAVGDLLAHAGEIAKSTGLADSTVHQHYDAGPWNVHIDKAGPVFIDWETDDLRPTDCLGPPLADVLYVVMYWYFLTSRATSDREEEAAVVRLFATPTPADAGVTAARMTIDRALLALGVERSVVPAALVAVWAERAVYTHRRRAGLGAPIGMGESRPEAYLRALAGATTAMCGPEGWWARARCVDP